MKILFKVIKTGSGNDIYFERLADALRRVHVDAKILYYHKLFQFVPFLLTLFNTPTDADIIHSNAEYAWVFKEKDKPLFASLFHNVFDEAFAGYRSGFQKIYHNLVLKPNLTKSLHVADKLIAISKFTKQSFIKTYGEFPIDVVYPVLDTDTYKPLKVKPDGRMFRLLYVGNLTRRKGADLLPNILRKLGPDFVLYYTSGLRTAPINFRSTRMIPLGSLTEQELIMQYNLCDALLFPSRLEGFGYAVIEAMSCGKPVITRKTTSLSEIIKNARGVFFTTPGDLSGLAEKLRYFRKTKNTVARTNRRIVQNNYSSASLIPQYEKLYSQ